MSIFSDIAEKDEPTGPIYDLLKSQNKLHTKFVPSLFDLSFVRSREKVVLLMIMRELLPHKRDMWTDIDTDIHRYRQTDIEKKERKRKKRKKKTNQS